MVDKLPFPQQVSLPDFWTLNSISTFSNFDRLRFPSRPALQEFSDPPEEKKTDGNIPHLAMECGTVMEQTYKNKTKKRISGPKLSFC